MRLPKPKLSIQSLLIAILFPLAAGSASAGGTPPDLLLVWPLDTAIVSLDSSVSTDVLTEGLTAGKPARLSRSSPALLVTRAFHPRFGEAIAHAARKVDVVDSSAANASLWSVAEEVRVRLANGDSATFALPVAADADSARYAMVLGRLAFSERTKTMGRRFLEPTPPGFDPATGEMTPGRHKGYSEGPGKWTTLTAKTVWLIWDRNAGVPVVAGTATASALFRGSARKSDWDEVARELAKDLLRQTPFTPF